MLDRNTNNCDEKWWSKWEIMMTHVWTCWKWWQVSRALGLHLVCTWFALGLHVANMIRLLVERGTVYEHQTIKSRAHCHGWLQSTRLVDCIGHTVCERQVILMLLSWVHVCTPTSYTGLHEKVKFWKLACSVGFNVVASHTSDITKVQVSIA